jgi:hypothetical protein
MSDWVPASRRTRIYVKLASVFWSVGLVAGFLSKRPDDAYYGVAYGLLFALLIGSWVITLWSALHCRDRRLRTGWLLVAAGQILSLSTSLYMVALSVMSAHPKYDSAAPLLTIAFLMVGGGIAVGASSVGGTGERRVPMLQAAGLSLLMLVVMLGALIGPGPSMPFAVGPRDITGIMRLVIDCGFIFGVGVYAMLMQLRLPQGHRARSWMWVAASALVAAMGDVAAPLVDMGHGQVYPGLLWCLGDVLLAVAASLAADFELAERLAEPSELGVEDAAESVRFAEPSKRAVEPTEV